MKKFFAFIFTIILCMNIFAACGMSDSLEIESITAICDEETGDTIVTIRYLDDMEAPLVFVLPKGEQGDVGQVGNGIKEVVPKDGATPGTTDLVIYFTDGTEFTVTVSDGKDGVSITNIKIVNDNPEGHPAGSKEVAFVDQNGEQIGDSFVIPAGKDGAEIDDIVGVPQNDGTVKVTVSYTDNNSKEFTIPGGRGIADIDSNMDGNEYLVIITYTDNSEPTTLRFTRPTGLLNGIGEPPSELGIIGDFYIDTDNRIIYKKIGEYAWDFIIDLKNERTPVKVKFMCDSDMSMEPGTSNEYTIPEGKSFWSEGFSIPVPQKSGYTFKGWYTTREPKPTHGAFTDLTPVTAQNSDESILILYALKSDRSHVVL